jgi:hypothetical protein
MTDHQGSRWLVGGRDMHAIKSSHQEWITENLLPRALAAGLRVAAIVIPRDAEAMMNIDDMAKAADDEIDVRYFSTVEKAREWLSRTCGAPLICATLCGRSGRSHIHAVMRQDQAALRDPPRVACREADVPGRIYRDAHRRRLRALSGASVGSDSFE